MARKKQRRIPAGAYDTFWERLSAPARHGLSLSLLLILSLSFFAPIHFGGLEIHGSDVVSWRANAEAMLAYEEATGEWALWATNVFAGMPGYLIHYPKAVPQLDTLLNVLRSFAWPTSHFFLLLAGAYFLVVYLTRNALSGLLAATAFGMTTYIPILLSTGHSTKFVALAYAPFVILAFIFAIRNPSLLASLLFGGALALELRANHPQITYYVMILIGLWWVVELVGAIRHDRSERLPKVGKATGWLALGTVLALLMVAQPYLATYEYKAFSVRGAAVEAGAGEAGAGALDWENAMQWSQGPGELVTLAIADAYGGGEAYWGPKPFTEGPHYLGGMVLALALLALWRVRSNAVYGLGLGALFTALFALGRHAPWINRPFFEYFPFFDAFRAPETWLSVTALTLAVLAGIGLDYALTPSEGQVAEDERRRSIYVAFGSLFGVVLLLLALNDTFFDFQRPNERQQLEMAVQQQRPDLSLQNPQVQRAIDQRMEQLQAQRAELFQQGAIRTLIFLGVAVFLLGLYRHENVPRWAVGGLVALLVVVDLWGVDKRYLNEDVLTQAPSAEAQIPTYGFNTFIKQRVEAAGGPGHFRTLPLALNPMNRALPSYHYEQIGGYHGAKLQRYQNYIDHVLNLDAPGPPNENALDLLSTRYIIARQRLPGTRVAYRDEQTSLLVLENEDFLPRAFFVGQTEVIADPQKTWARLRDTTFAPRETALLPEPLDAPITPIDSASTTTVTLETYTPREIVWEVETDAPRLLVASEIYYPAGWKAAIDGEPVPIYRADYLLRAVHVPAGEHTVTMRFDPQVHGAGVWVSGASTAFVYGGVLVLLGLPYLRRRRRKKDEEA